MTEPATAPLLALWADIAALERAGAVLGWDQETMMPAKGQPGRGRTLAALAGQIGDKQIRAMGTLGGSVANNDPAACYPSAVLALVGVINVPIIHFSVEWWSTLHQPASVTKLAKPSVHIEMLIPLFIMMAGFQLYFGWIISRRLRGEILQGRDGADVREILTAQHGG